MGIWHQRSIAYKTSCKENLNLSSNFSKKIDFKQVGNVALLSSPYISSTFYQSYLQAKEGIILAIDGQISNLKNNSSLIDEVVNLYLTYGNGSLYQLEGSFSLVLYDTKKQTTLLYRSFLKGNPLYYVARNNFLTVSTNPIYLLRRSDVSDRLGHREMSSIFSLSFSQWNNTVFADITELKHGEMVIITETNIEHKKKKLAQIFTQQEYGSEIEVIEKYRYLLDNAVKKSLLKEVKHGIMLSSGIDSSSLAVLASKIFHEQDRELTAYSWILPNDPLGDESEKIKELCKKLNIPLKLFNGEKYGPFDSLDKLLLLPDTPYTNPFWPITEEIYRRAANDDVGGLLNGNYADVLFRGSRDLLVDIVRDKKFELLMPTIQFIIQQRGYSKLLKSPAVRGLLRNLLPSYSFRKRPYPIAEWLSQDAKAYQKEVFEENQLHIEEGFEHFSTALSSFQVGSLGMDRYLSGAYGIKRIEPHRDLELLNYSLNIPSYMVYRNGQTKYFAREAMRGLLPESIRLQPRVGDLNTFIQNSYERNKKKVREMLLDERLVWKQYVDETWMEDKLKSTETLSYADFLVFWLSLNMQQWTKAIKPGGSLYEGTFLQNTSQGLQE